MTALDLVIAVATQGVQMWREGDRIRWRGGLTLPPELREEVMRRRDEVHELLDAEQLERDLAHLADRLWFLEQNPLLGEGYERLLSDYAKRLDAYVCVYIWQREAIAA